MNFGVIYHPEQWVYPYGGAAENSEAAWERDAEMMAKAGINVVCMGDCSWGLCEPHEEWFDFGWLQRAMDLMGEAGIKVMLATPTAAPPVWLAKKHPELFSIDEQGLPKEEGVCLNSDAFWDYSRRVVENMAKALGKHPQLIAWRIDHGACNNSLQTIFNEDTRRDWHGWLEAKYENIERLNDLMGLRHRGQIVAHWNQVPIPTGASFGHNPALLLDWSRFCSDTVVQFVKMQADLLREMTPKCPVTASLRRVNPCFDRFDLAQVIDFISIETSLTPDTSAAESACEIDLLRSTKKTDIHTPDSDESFWVIRQKRDPTSKNVNSLLRPGVLRMLVCQLISRGATGVFFSQWRKPRFGPEKFHKGLIPHKLQANGRIYQEVAHLGDEVKLLAPALKNTRVTAETCILFSHDNEWALDQPVQMNPLFNLREHIQLFYSSLHDRNIPVDFAKPAEDLSKYKLVIAPSLHLLAGGEADLLKLYVQNGGTLVATFNTGLVDEYNMAPDTGYPHDLTDLFGLEVLEFDHLPPNQENHLTFKGAFPTSHLHPARIWCDIIEPGECQILATYAKDFYAGRAAMTMHTFGLGKAIYIGTQSHQHFYNDLIVWLRQMCNLHPLLKVPEHIEVSLREKDDAKIYFLLNHQDSPVRVQFYKPMHDFLTGNKFSGNYDLPPHGVLVLDEHNEGKTLAEMAQT